MNYQFSVPCLMGVEALVADELRFNRFADVSAENGKVRFSGDMGECARANVILRCGERVLLNLASFRATTFDELFEGVKAIEWENFIGQNDEFPVKGYSVSSKLFSVPDCQKIVKKAVVERLKLKYGVSWFAEDGCKLQIRFSLLNDRCEISLDTTGAPLFKRGYKLETTDATLRETLAASIVKVARYRGREALIDPFCGSGTIAIEAALAALGVAPGARRKFEAEQWGFCDTSVFAAAREEAIARERHEKLPITASDLSAEAVALTEENARRAGVLDCIEVRRADATRLDFSPWQVMMTNPPYGVRLLDVEQARALYAALGSATKSNPQLKMYVLSSDESFETQFGRQCDKKRKLYNGMIKCGLYMYFKNGN